MTITAEIVCDSITETGSRVTSFIRTYPRIVHSETLRHRVVSPSVASSRAVPVMRMLSRVIEDPAEPFEWGSNKPGMVAGADLSGWRLWLTRRAWHTAKWGAIASAYVAHKAGAHKQICNRIIEPWTHTVEIVTATDWNNWFDLRLHEDADPTVRELARVMLSELTDSRPKKLYEGEWHLPLVTDDEKRKYPTAILRSFSAARCARASYLNHDKSNPEIGSDIDLAAKLAKSKHWSPFEHQATPYNEEGIKGLNWDYGSPHGNFDEHWIQNRQLIQRGDLS